MDPAHGVFYLQQGEDQNDKIVMCQQERIEWAETGNTVLSEP